MSVSRTAATAARVLSQLRRDPRTIVLLLVVPCVLILLVDQLFAGREQVFQSVGVPMLGLFPLISMFLVTSITMLRERTTGTLERLLTTPLTKLELLVGYGIAFAAVAIVQADDRLDRRLRAARPRRDALGRARSSCSPSRTRSSGWRSGSSSARSPRRSSRRCSSCPRSSSRRSSSAGCSSPRIRWPAGCRRSRRVLPLTYAFDALDRAAHEPTLGPRFWADVAVIVGATLLALVLGAATLRRRTP